MKTFLLLLLGTLSFSVSVISSEFGNLASTILSLLDSSRWASVVALSANEPEFLEKLRSKEHWILLEYPSSVQGKVDNSPGLLHAKFMIFDTGVIFGSMNFTTSSLFDDLNDALIFSEPCAVAFFSKLMDSLWIGRSPPSEWRCENLGSFYVSPYVDLEPIFMKVLDKAKKYVLVSVYAFTDMNVFGALKYLSSKNVKVRIAVDDWNERWILKENLEGFQVKVFKNLTLHHKFVVVDGKYLITGSANITESAFRKNLEVIFLTERRDIIMEYEEIFEILWRW